MSSGLIGNVSTPLRLSPVHDALTELHPWLGEHVAMPVALDFGDQAAEMARAGALGLCDVSALLRIVVNGPAAAEFLVSQGVPTPQKVLHTVTTEGGSIVARTGTAEFFIEDGIRSDVVSRLQTALAGRPPGCYAVLRQDASFLLSGARAAEVLLETCAYDFRQPGDAVVVTRVAGVSCAILSREINHIPVFQFWLDPSFGTYLWETLLAIARDLHGHAVGAAVFFPEFMRTVPKP